jgi:hypothetical protein
MTNTNCLENIQCPNCRNEESFRIAGTAIFTVTDDGTEDHGDIEWDDDSYAECAQCHRHGTLAEFKVRGDRAKPPTGITMTETAPATRLLVPSGNALTAGKLYLQLYHGRTDPDQQMDDWGSTGPTFGPLACVVHTYLTTIRLRGENDHELWLRHHDDMTVWQGAYFGDISIFVATGDEHG